MKICGICLILLLGFGCERPQTTRKFATLDGEENGRIIKKTSEGEYPPTIQFEALKYRQIGDSMYLPVRVTCMQARGVFTFDSTELTDQYTEYLNAKAQLVASRVAYNRQQELLDARVSSEKEYYEARIKYQEVARNVNKIENNFRIIGIPLNVISRLREGSILISGDVPENELHTVHRNMKIRIDLHAYAGKAIEAKIGGVSEQINPSTRTAKIYLQINNHKHLYSPGMFGTGLIERTGKRSLAVPASAVIQIGSKSFAFRVKNPLQIERVEIETEAEDNGFIAITAGLAEGDQIVTRGASLLKGLSFGY